jgi:hypothetical protein
LGGATRNWSTPRGSDAKCGTEYTEGMTGCDLAKDVTEFWKTPHGMANMDASGKHGGAGGGEFAKQANAWPTPQVADDNLSRTEDPDYAQRWTDREKSGSSLAITTALWTTPQAHDSGGGALNESAAKEPSTDAPI